MPNYPDLEMNCIIMIGFHKARKITLDWLDDALGKSINIQLIRQFLAQLQCTKINICVFFDHLVQRSGTCQDKLVMYGSQMINL